MARALLLTGGVTVLALGALVAAWVATRPPTTATLSIEPHLDGRKLTIVGASDLPDGTRVTWSVWNEKEAANLATLYSIYEHAVLSGGRFEVSADLSAWPAGSTRVWAAFDPGPDQPAETIAKVGEWGERLSGPGVVEDSGGPRLIAYTSIALPGK